MNLRFALQCIWFFLPLAGLHEALAGEREDQFAKAIQNTGTKHNFNGQLMTEDMDHGYKIDYGHYVAPQKIITVSFVSFDTKEQMEQYHQLADAFKKAAQEIYSSLPQTKISKHKIDGIAVTETDTKKAALKSRAYNTESPANRTVSFHPSAKEMITVSCIGGGNPVPIAKTLIEELRLNGLLGIVEEAETFEIKVSAKGFLPKSTTFTSATFSPTRFSLSGKILDDNNRPINGAKIDVTSHSEVTFSDMNGTYSLSIDFDGGSKPYPVTADFTLEPITTDIVIKASVNDTLLVPEEIDLNIRATDKKDKPIKGTVDLIVSSPFAAAKEAKGKLDHTGTWNTKLSTQLPGQIDTIPLSKEALRVQVAITVTPADGGQVGNKIINVPLNLALITGETTGPDMKGREESEPPNIAKTVPAIIVDRWKGKDGSFRVLVHPLHPTRLIKKTKWELAWSDANRLPLELPITQPIEAGAIIELGKIDLLTPEEHQQRLIQTLIGFSNAMGLTSTELQRFHKAINRLRFQYGSTHSVPSFRDNFFDDSGIVHIPGSENEYWGKNLQESNSSDDAAYEIIAHELGHFMHHHIVERYSYRNICYNDVATGDHNTWHLEPGVETSKQPYLSFSENTADFFGVLFREFWKAFQPHIGDSRYFQKEGYFHEFDSDEKAMACLSSGLKGYQIEGIQTRFLNVFYGEDMKKRPTRVMNDYLNSMLLYMDTKTYLKGNLANRPARTIYQWVYSKLTIPGAMGHRDILSLAGRYKVNKLDPVPTASPVYKQKEVVFYVDGKKVDFGRYQVTSALYSNRLKLVEGMVAIDLSDGTTRRTCILNAPCEIRLKSHTEIEVFAGIISVDFPATIHTPGGTVKPKGTVVQVEVDPQATTTIRVLEGKAEIKSISDQSTILEESNAIDLSPDGRIGTPQPIQVDQWLEPITPNIVMPTIEQKHLPAQPNWLEPLSRIPGWAKIVLGFWTFLILTTAAFLFRYVIAAILFCPIIALSISLLGRSFLATSAINETDWLTYFISPWRMVADYGDWIPVAAWLLGAIFAGLWIRDGLCGWISGIFYPVLPWLIVVLRVHNIDASNFSGWHTEFSSFSSALPNLGLLIALCMLGSLLGAFFGPRKRQRNKEKTQVS